MGGGICLRQEWWEKHEELDAFYGAGSCSEDCSCRERAHASPPACAVDTPSEEAENEGPAPTDSAYLDHPDFEGALSLLFSDESHQRVPATP
jgi:hypothetical protein